MSRPQASDGYAEKIRYTGKIRYSGKTWLTGQAGPAGNDCSAERSQRKGSPWAMLGLGATGAVLARAAMSAVVAATTSGWRPPGSVRGQARVPVLRATNFRGRPVSLAAGPAVATAGSLTAAAGAWVEGDARLAAAALVAGLGAGGVGLYDDMVGARPGEQAKGLRGHLAALRRGQLTAGVVKLVGIGAAGVAAAALIPSRRPRGGRPLGRAARALEVALGAGVVAGTANVVNLCDLRPGRALKVGLLLGGPIATPGAAVVAGPLGAAAALLPADLDERVMLGDTGANSLGALLGVALAARRGLAGRAALLGALAALTVASEKVSFTQVIEASPALRVLDQLGRRAP